VQYTNLFNGQPRRLIFEQNDNEEESVQDYPRSSHDELFDYSFSDVAVPHREAELEQFQNSLFPSFEDDCPPRMERMLNLELGLWNHGAAQRDDSGREEDIRNGFKVPMCCNGVVFTMPQGKVNSAKALELFFISHFSNDLPFKTFNEAEVPGWWKHGSVKMRISVYDQTDDGPTRWFVLRKGDRDVEGRYELCEIWTDR
jgi:hypothetical protein